MDAIRTLLLERTHTVVLDPDRVANASTRPVRDAEIDKFEDELAQLGFVMSLDLAVMLRRLPGGTLVELRSWMVDTLAKQLGAHRPHVPLFRAFPAGTPRDTVSLYLRRVLTWLATRPEQPCPWCGQVKTVAPLDPCGHLVCRSCWDGGNYAGCPICHRRVAAGEPFVRPSADGSRETVTRHAGELGLLHLGFDLVGAARERFGRILARQTPLSPEDRAEIEVVIDAIGPKVVLWLPSRIPIKETMAIAIARLWMVGPDRSAMVRATIGHVRTATDVLRIAAVLMGGNPELVEPMRLRSIGRGLRRAILEALDRMPIDQVVEDVGRHAGLWKRVGERLHPYEWADRYVNAALAFAIVRETTLARVSFGEALRAHAETLSSITVGDSLHVAPWAAPVEDGLRAGQIAQALERLARRPGELLRRADHLVRVTQARPPDLRMALAAIQQAIPRGAPAMLLVLASHVARRGTAWPRRVFFPKGEVLHAWGTGDTRPPLPTDAIGAIVGAVRGELVARAGHRRHFARGVIDRALGDLLVPAGERTASKARIAWPRGSEVSLPPGGLLRLFLHWEEPTATRVDLDLSVAFFDGNWRHVATCDFTSLRVGDTAAVHSGDLTSAPAPLGASEFVDLHLERLHALGARHAVMVVFSYNAISFDRLTFGFAGLMISPAAGAHFDPRAVAQRFDLHGRSLITVPLAIDLEARRLRWLDVAVRDRGEMHQVGGYRAALAHIGRDFESFVGSHARPTMWDVAAIHAAARANVVYVRERDGVITTYRRRDGETAVARLGRLLSGASDDGRLAAVPTANAPTWFAVLDDRLAIPAGSVGYILDARGSGGDAFDRLAAADLVAELAAR